MVYATPVYVDGMTAQLKTFMDSFIIGALPFVGTLHEHGTFLTDGQQVLPDGDRQARGKEE